MITYYRVIFKNSDQGVGISEIAENSISDEMFNSMNLDPSKPIIAHNDGRYLHFISLDKSYLECMIAGISAYMDASKLPPTNDPMDT